jgi:reactive intermediate/imine deaminase
MMLERRSQMTLTHLTAPDAAPAPPSAKYSHAVKAGPFLYVTGQLPADPDDPEAPLPEGIAAQTHLSFKNLNRILRHAGYSFEDTVFVRVFLTNFKRDYAGMNEVFFQYYTDEERLPARTTVGVSGLGRDGLVEIDMVLYRAEAG